MWTSELHKSISITNTALSFNHYSEQLSGEGLLLLIFFFVKTTFTHVFYYCNAHINPNLLSYPLVSPISGFQESCPFLMDFLPFLSPSCCTEPLFIKHLFPGVLLTCFMLDCPQLHSEFPYLILLTNFINVFSSFLRCLIKIRPKQQALIFPHFAFALFIITFVCCLLM